MMPKGDMTSAAFRQSGLQIRNTSGGRRDYKADLLEQIKAADVPEPVTEHVFHPERKWRFDFAWIDEKLAVEYDGGIFDGAPSHSSVSGILRDKEKVTEAQLAGWIVIQVTAQTVANGAALRYIIRGLKRAKSAILTGETRLALAKRKLLELAESLDK